MNYPSIRIEGAILSPDILDRLDDAPGQRPADFGLDSGAKVKDEIARAWADAQDYWRIFQRKLETLRPESPATTETRQQWITPLLGLLGYQLEYQAKGVELNGKTYAISHRVTNRGQTPIHIIGAREVAGLDRKPERTHIGAPRMSAHALVQEYLNLHDELYGLVTNGRVLRLLRDSSRLIKLSYLEFDLDRIFSDGLFADFAILYRLLHVTRLPQTIEASSTCWLERYHQDSIEQGTRIREGLRVAVTEALEILGTGFLAHPDNQVFRQQIADGQVKADTYFNHLLRIVYRLLFLMVIEERGLVFPKGTPSRNLNLYYQHYSVQRLRRLAITRGLKVERFHDAWLALLATFQIFEHPEQAAAFGATVLGGQLFHPESLGPLAACRLSNAALFSALDRLCYFDDPKTGQRTPVNFGALATEEFGSVYESLLELHPIAETTPTPHFGFKQAAGNERKTSGSYYTPASLVDCLLDSALNPVLDERIRNFANLGYKSADDAVLALKVCDPACGSGHFIIAAAQRIARRLAILRAGDEEPAPDLLRHTLREVIGHCIHGVDINPMSVELCKLGLWLEAVEPGKPLTFLDHHIKCGNSLLGATPKAIKGGIPDDAYKPITGDTKEAAAWMKKLNQAARAGQGGFDFSHAEPWDRLGNLPAAIVQLENLDDDTPEALEKKEKLYRDIVQGSGYDNARLLHDAWCAAFVWPKHSTDYGTELTTEHLRNIERNPHSVAPQLKEQVRALSTQYRFFHWHLEFPAVFDAEGEGGFDVMLGNPPWERVKLQEKEFFAERSTEIANAPNAAARKRLIAQLTANNPGLMSEFQTAQRQAEGESHLLRDSGFYPLCGRGDITRCARSYLDDEGDFAYVPYGLDILEGLAGASKKLKGMVDAEYAQSAPDKSAFVDLTGATAVGKLIAGLSHRTKPEQVEALATLTVEETARHAELGKSLKEVSPTDKAKQLRLRASRIAKVAQNAAEKLAIVDDAAAGKLRGLAEAYYAAQLAAKLAAQQFKEDASLLPGTGDASWKALFEAARKFSVEAFPNVAFPELGPEAQCPLCQQPLAEGAERLRRFEAFIQQEVEKTSESRKKTLDDNVKVFSGQNVCVTFDHALEMQL